MRQDDFSIAVDVDETLVRLLHRRDAWGLPYGWDVPPCAPEVPLTADADEQRERSGMLLARLWEGALVERWGSPLQIPQVSPVELTALGVDREAPGHSTMTRWIAARREELRALSEEGPRADPGWCLWEALACAGEGSVCSVTVLPVSGDWLERLGSRILVSFDLYGAPDRFVDAAMAR